jgi:hypothetical protein
MSFLIQLNWHSVKNVRISCCNTSWMETYFDNGYFIVWLQGQGCAVWHENNVVAPVAIVDIEAGRMDYIMAYISRHRRLPYSIFNNYKK